VIAGAEPSVLSPDDRSLFGWWRDADRRARHAFIAASLGWMLDSFDVMLYALVLPSLMSALTIDASTAGRIQSFTLLSAAAGGLVFGVVADRFGRTRALMASVLIYSVFTAACGFATTAAQLAVFRICLGIGMGGEWASGAALVSETWPDRHRGKALAFMQSSWAIGYALATATSWFIQRVLGLDWRVVFFVGVLPALFTWWIRRRVEEPAIWRRARTTGDRPSFYSAIRGPMLMTTAALTLMNSCTLFAYWGFNTWVPTYLSSGTSLGGIGLGTDTMSLLVYANQMGTWCGYVTFGYISDVIGRKRTYIGYLLFAAALVWAYTSTRNVWMLLALGPIASFFATGHFSGFGAVTAELYPTAVRATAQGFTYNIGRIASAAAPWLIGSLAKTHGFPAALSLSAVAFVLAALCWIVIPETKGQAITAS
jgi:MFS family permease